jgi:septum site-determining protein MinD
VTLSNPASAPARAYAEAARRLSGEAVSVSLPGDRRGLMARLFGRRAA